MTVTFAALMAVVIIGIGLLLYARFESELNRTIDDGVRARVDALATLVAQRHRATLSPADGQRLLAREDGFVQIMRPTGVVVASTPQVRRVPLLSHGELRRAQHGLVLITRHPLTSIAKRARIAARPAAGDLVVVVAHSLKDREGANESFARALLIGGPLALLFAAAAGYGLAVAVLRPVESMRARAATISADEPGARLPVPPADDELGRLGSTLNDMLARVEAGLVHERALTANASHELRTPLAVLKGELELALRHDRSHAELIDALRAAAVETDRLASMADDLLVLARADTGNGALTLEARSVDLDELVARVAARFASRAAAVGREIEVDCAPIRVRADAGRLEQAVSNLVDNALRHGSGRVRAVTRLADDRVEIHVIDEGAGISAEFAPYAFERFRRGTLARNRDGAGLGLAIVDAVARAHGGVARVDCADIWISLPS